MKAGANTRIHAHRTKTHAVSMQRPRLASPFSTPRKVPSHLLLWEGKEVRSHLLLCMTTNFTGFPQLAVSYVAVESNRKFYCLVIRTITIIWVNVHWKKASAESCPTLAIPWTVACQAPLTTGFSRQEYWSGLTISFSRGTSQPRNWTQDSHVAGRCITNWATWEALVHWKVPNSVIRLMDLGMTDTQLCPLFLSKEVP